MPVVRGDIETGIRRSAEKEETNMNFFRGKNKKIVAAAIGIILIASMVLSLVVSWI